MAAVCLGVWGAPPWRGRSSALRSSAPPTPSAPPPAPSTADISVSPNNRGISGGEDCGIGRTGRSSASNVIGHFLPGSRAKGWKAVRYRQSFPGQEARSIREGGHQSHRHRPPPSSTAEAACSRSAIRRSSSVTSIAFSTRFTAGILRIATAVSRLHLRAQSRHPSHAQSNAAFPKCTDSPTNYR